MGVALAQAVGVRSVGRARNTFSFSRKLSTRGKVSRPCLDPHPPWAPATTRHYSSPQCLPSTAHRSLHRSLHRSGGGGHDEGSKAPALMEVPVADTWVWPLPHYHPLSGSQRRVPSLFVTFSRRSLSFRFTLHQGGGEGRPGAGPPSRAGCQVRPARGREQCMYVAWAPTGELGPLGAWVGKRKPLSVLASL